MATEEHKELIKSEVVAKLIGLRLNNEKFLKKYATKDDAMIKKILRFLKATVTHLKDKDKATAAEVRELVNMFDKVLLNGETFNENKISYFTYKTGKSDIKQESKILLTLLFQNIDNIPDDIVFEIESDGIVSNPKKSEYVNDIFTSQGGVAISNELGEVKLSNKGAKNTIFHGYGKNKLIAAYAIKPVIEKGKVISTTLNYENSGVDRYVIAAKGVINGSYAYVSVVVEGYPINGGHKQFYLHEVIITETVPHIMTATQENADTVSGTVSNTSIPQKSDLSTGSEKKVDGKRDLAPRKADKAEKKIEKLEKEKAEAQAKAKQERSMREKMAREAAQVAKAEAAKVVIFFLTRKMNNGKIFLIKNNSEIK